MPRALCLDTNVIVQYLVPESLQAEAEALILEALEASVQLVAPAFIWAEVGSVLRKKIRRELLTAEEAQGYFEDFCDLPIDYLENEQLRTKAWEVAQLYHLPTLYDAAFMACAEITDDRCQFWTADKKLLNQLGSSRPAYVRELGT